MADEAMETAKDAMTTEQNAPVEPEEKAAQ